MAIDKVLLDLLVCPDSREKLTLADAGVVDKLNAAIERGEIKNRAGRKVEARLDAGLVRADNKFLYPVQGDIPNLLIDEAIPLDQLG